MFLAYMYIRDRLQVFGLCKKQFTSYRFNAGREESIAISE